MIESQKLLSVRHSGKRIYERIQNPKADPGQAPIESGSRQVGARMTYKKGFTLIELLVVIIIIGILATFLFANFVNSQQRARDQQRKTDLQNIRTNLESIKLDKGVYPLVGGTGYPSDCGSTSELKSGVAVYMKNFPCDPSKGAGYWNSGKYFYCVDAFSYALFACLENTSDNDINTTVDPTDPALTLPSGCSSSVPSSCAKYYYLTNI